MGFAYSILQLHLTNMPMSNIPKEIKIKRKVIPQS